MLTGVRKSATELFPACAGVIPKRYPLSSEDITVPRMRGGDPWWQHPALN